MAKTELSLKVEQVITEKSKKIQEMLPDIDEGWLEDIQYILKSAVNDTLELAALECSTTKLEEINFANQRVIDGAGMIENASTKIRELKID